MNIRYKNSERSEDPFIIQTGKFDDVRSGTIYRAGWAEDTYISEPKNNQETVGQNFDMKKLPVYAAILFFFIAIILFRAAFLQIIKGDYYFLMAEGNRIRIERVEPERGVIYDRNMNVLVRNKANFMLYIVPADLPAEEDLNSLFFQIENIIGEGLLDEAREKIKAIKKNSLETYQPMFIKDNIEYEKAMKLYLKSADWPGVVLTSKSGREYPFTEENGGKSISLSHVLGYTGKINEQELKQYGNEYLPIDYIGKMGIEYFWENELKGMGGRKQIEVDALGKEKKVISKTDAISGNNLKLSLDLNQQVKLEEILKGELNQTKLKKGIAIAIDPNNGEILALINLPSFNNNIFARGISKEEYSNLINDKDMPLFNRAVSGEYPSGSTIKPIMASAALEEGIINENTSVLSNGGIRVGQWFFPDWKAGGHGITNVRKAIAESVNTFFYYIGGGYQDFKGLGIEKMIYYFDLFGLGAQTGIDLPGEADGFLPSKEWKEKEKNETWYIGDTYHVSIGQGDLLVTPIQVAAYTCFFANGGKLYRPHLVTDKLSEDNKNSEHIKIEPIRENIIKPYSIQIVREGMRKTVENGSARSLQSVPVPVAGKTGTAQWSSKEKNHAWFIGFAPYDKPEIAIIVLLEAGGEGSSVAVPVARDYLNWYFGTYKKATTTQLIK